MAEYSKVRQKFVSRGVNLNRPVDLQDETHYPVLKNIRSYQDGVLRPRAGISLIYDVDTSRNDPVHSIQRLNTSSRSAYITGAGTGLYSDDASHIGATEIDRGYSGNPLSIITHRPEKTPDAWAYVMDSLRTRKVKVDGTNYPIGIAPPNLPADVSIEARSYQTIEEFESIGSWTNGGTAGAISLLASKRVDTTITQILYDSGLTGWATCSPATLDSNLRPGMLLNVNPSGGTSETVLVEDVTPAITDTTIQAVLYDEAGLTGLCTIQLTAPSATLKRDSMVRIAASENVRVLSVTSGSDGITSFRCYTTATRSAGDAVAGLASFRAYYASTHFAGEVLRGEAFESTISTGTGYINKVGTFDIQIVRSRPLKPDDEVHISLRVDNPELVTGGKVMFDVNSTTHNFDENFYYYNIRANDFTADAQSTLPALTVQQRAIQRKQIDEAFQNNPAHAIRKSGTEFQPFTDAAPFDVIDPAIGDNQTALGDSQWSEIRFRVGDMVRVGTDSSRTLKHIQALRIQLTVTGAVVADFDSWWVGGTYGVTGERNYICAYRNKETGAQSNPSPPMRSPVKTQRGRTTLTPSYATDSQVDLIDWYTYSDTLYDWYYIGTQPNSGTFTDKFSNEDILNNPLARFNLYQPFPIVDIPRSGTCTVIGTEVTWVSGDTFNTSWARGVVIKINGVPYTFYNSPTSTTRLSLNENAGYQTSVTFEIAEALILGQPRPIMFGAYGGGQSGIIMFSVDQGTLIWTNPNNPDASSDRNRLEITSPSEPLMNGFIYDGRPYALSTERMFSINPSFGAVASDFVVQEVANSVGLYARYALCVAEGGLVYFVGRDGIYKSEGGFTQLITSPLRPLFPHDGIDGVATNAYLPPDFAYPDKMRLSHKDNYLRFIAQDIEGTLRCWVFNILTESWDSEDTIGASVFYAEDGEAARLELVGGFDGKLYKVLGTSDNGTDISVQVRTPSMDAGDSRVEKTFGDIALDVNCASETLSVIVGFDNHTTLLDPVEITNSSRGLVLISTEDRIAKNVSLDIQCSTSEIIELFEWQASFLPETEDTSTRATDWEDGGFIGAKWLQGCYIHCNTGGEDKTVEVQGDNGEVVATLIVNSGGEGVTEHSFEPFITHLMRLVPTDTVSWKFYQVEWKFNPHPPLATRWKTQRMSLGGQGYETVRDALIALVSTDVVTMTINVDGVDYSYEIASTSGEYRKVYVPLDAVKGKLRDFDFSSDDGHRLFKEDCELRYKTWGSGGGWNVAKPFGAIHNTVGSEI